MLVGLQISSVTQLCKVVYHHIGMLRRLSVGLYLTAFYQNTYVRCSVACVVWICNYLCALWPTTDCILWIL